MNKKANKPYHSYNEYNYQGRGFDNEFDPNKPIQYAPYFAVGDLMQTSKIEEMLKAFNLGDEYFDDSSLGYVVGYKLVFDIEGRASLQKSENPHSVVYGVI